MKNTNVKRFSLWSAVALSMTLCGAMLSRGVIAQEKPMFISGTDVPKAFQAGKPNATILRMKQCYSAMKAHDWSPLSVPFEMLQTPDQAFAEDPQHRAKNVTAFSVPREAVYSEVAMYTDLYFRRNIVQYSHRTASHPEGFWLVMFKDGRVEKVKGEDVRMYPHPTIPDAMMPVFPGMSVYKPGLPKLSCYDVAE